MRAIDELYIRVKAPMGVLRSLRDPRLRSLVVGSSGLWSSAKTGSDTSFAGEGHAIDRLLKALGVEGGYCVDLGASDGVSMSSTLRLFASNKWRGLAVEMDPLKFAELAIVYSQFSNVRLARQRIIPANVSDLMAAFEVPRDFEFLNLDIDSYDLAVIDALLSDGYRPALVSMEINEKVPPPLLFTVLYAEDHYWQGDHFFGCSASAADLVLRSHGYRLAEIRFNNALFVRNELLGRLGHVHDLSHAYQSGYSRHPQRAAMFPWNADVDEALEMESEDAVAFFEKTFERYAGHYVLTCDEVDFKARATGN